MGIEFENSGTYQLDPELGWVPAVPEPFWYKGWRSWFRWRPQCVECDIIFATKREWVEHYVLKHIGPFNG
jgi:hypothetical protein